MPREGGRRPDQLRPLVLEPDFLEQPHGSVLYRQGRTIVLCTASVEERVPRWLMHQGRGWVTAEYSLLPASTGERTDIRIMAIDTEWKLLTPEGAVAWTGGDGMVFDPAHSKYTDRQKSGYSGFGPGGVRIDALDFGCRDPTEAMIEELREKYTGPAGLPNKFPLRLVKTADGYTAAIKKVRFDVGP